jgi:hypothetical protein
VDIGWALAVAEPAVGDAGDTVESGSVEAGSVELGGDEWFIRDFQIARGAT